METLTKYIKWDDGIYQLEKFYEDHNHFNIPKNNPKYENLRKFTIEIDKMIINGKPQHKGHVKFIIEMRERLDFYIGRLEKVSEYKISKSSTKIPWEREQLEKWPRKFYKSNQSSYNWDSVSYDKNGKVITISGEELMKIYNNLDYKYDRTALEKEWRPFTRTTEWAISIDKLGEFYEKFNHYEIPSDYPDYKNLSTPWTKLRNSIEKMKPQF